MPAPAFEVCGSISPSQFTPADQHLSQYCDSTGVSPLSPVPEESTPNPNLLSPATAAAPINFDSYALSPSPPAASTFSSTLTAPAIPFPPPTRNQRDEEREALSTWEAWFFSEEQQEDCNDWVERRRGSAPEASTQVRKVSVESLPPPLPRPTPFLRRPSTPYPPPVTTSSSPSLSASSTPASSQPPSPTSAPSFVTAVWPGSRPGSRPGSVLTSESTPPVTPTSAGFPPSQPSTEATTETLAQLKPPANASLWSKLVGRRKSAPELYHRPRLSPSTTIGTTVTTSSTTSSARRPSVALLPPQPELPGSRRPSIVGSLYPPSVPVAAPSTATSKVLKKEKKEKECSAVRQLKKQQSKKELDEALEKAFERACSYGTRRPSMTKY
ncbi:hypothetical protein JCM21900_001209 [Sporobolomyces salmonicolor]